MITRWIISALLLVGLTFGGFGKHILAPDKQAQAEAYILAGGDWAELCSDGTGPLAHAAKCIACVINHGGVLPPHSTAAYQQKRSISVAWMVSSQPILTSGNHDAHAARGPPFI